MTASITVCGLGPGGPEHLTAATRAAIDAADRCYLRTSRHPTAHLAGTDRSFDHLYEAADTFDAVYRGIADELVAAAADGPVTYVVPGSPLVLERSVAHLLADDRAEVEVIPALSFLDVVWARLGVDPIDGGVRLVDGHRFATEAAGERGPLLVAHAHAPWVLSDVKLALDADDDQRIVVLQRLGTDEERVVEVGADELDRVIEPDHLTSLYLPEMAAPVARELARTVALMHRLRRDCPWDRKQTHRSLRPYLLEESYEVLEAIDGLPDAVADPGHPGEPVASLAVGDDEMAAYVDLEEELGDLWFQILFHAELATEAGHFTIADVARTVHEKLVRRHPHVFGDVEVSSTDDVVANWDAIKTEEKQRDSALDGIPAALPALSLAAKVLSRVRRADQPATVDDLAPGLIDALDAAATVGRAEAEEALGRGLLAAVAWAAEHDLDPEDVLRAAVVRAQTRFRVEEGAGSVSPTWLHG
ncbi:MAG: MazG nucleotide pyrophosphohydrolase domain-containing protein [Actinomycetota bacterium]